VRPRVEQLAGWGRAAAVEAHEADSEDPARITDGDSSLPASTDHEAVSTVLADRVSSFDETGKARLRSRA
jgi:hypothetical protein